MGGGCFRHSLAGRRPGRTPRDEGDVRARRHRHKVFLPLVNVDVLRFVTLEHEVRGPAHHVGVRVGRKEQAARAAQFDDIALAPAPKPRGPRVAQAIAEPQVGST